MSSLSKFNIGLFVTIMSALGLFILANTKQEPNIMEQFINDKYYWVYGILYCFGCTLMTSGIAMRNKDISLEWIRTSALIGLINFIGATIVIFHLKAIFNEGLELALRTLPLMGIGCCSAVMSVVSVKVYKLRRENNDDT